MALRKRMKASSKLEKALRQLEKALSEPSEHFKKALRKRVFSLLAPAAGHTRLAQLVVMVMVINSAYTGPLPHYL